MIAQKVASLFANQEIDLNWVSSVEQPCRFQKVIYRERTVILDVAHNEQGLTAVLD
jgi:folylpolyglutamate synthase/dihydropteroate synthase